MRSVLYHGLLLQCAFHIHSVSGAVMFRKPSAYRSGEWNSTQAALAAREALRADLDSQTTSGEDFDAFIQACDRSADSERAVDRIGMHQNSNSKNHKDQQYYRDTWCAIRFFGEGARSIVDVGSSFPPFVTSTDWIPEREITSKYFPGNERPCGTATKCVLQDGVQANIMDFYNWRPSKVYDVALSMQVIEHVSNPTRFMRKLLKTGRTVVVTVPYKWDDHHMQFHKHHKMALEDMRQWAGKHELHFHISQDSGKGQLSQRLLMVFQGDVGKESQH